jgi:hypothetical protein
MDKTVVTSFERDCGVHVKALAAVKIKTETRRIRRFMVAKTVL